MTVKRNSRTAECPVDSQGISVAREFRRNIECLKAETTDSQPIDKLLKIQKKILLLGGYNLLLPVIKAAHEQG